MSLLGKVETDVQLKIAANRFHDVFSCRPHHVSNMTPGNIQGCDLHEGEFGKSGTVICWNYVHDGEAKVAKEIVEAVDDENLSTTFKVIEGDLLKDFKSFRLIVKATPVGPEECSVHWILEYEKLHDAIVDPHTLLQFCADVSKDIEAHHLKDN